MKKIMFYVMLILIVMTNALSAQVEDWEATVKKEPRNIAVLIDAGIGCHDIARDGSEKAAKLSEKYLSRVLEIEPRNGMAMIYYGSLMSIMARDAGEPWEQMEYMQRAFAKMDKAVMLYPDDIHIRLVRGVNHCYLPDMFNRLDTALEDLSHIEALLSQEENVLNNLSMVTWLYHYGLALQSKGKTQKASHYYKKVAELAPDSPLGKQARHELEAMR